MRMQKDVPNGTSWPVRMSDLPVGYNQLNNVTTEDDGRPPPDCYRQPNRGDVVCNIQGPLDTFWILELSKRPDWLIADVAIPSFPIHWNPVMVWDIKIDKVGAPDLIKEPQMCEKNRPAALLSRTVENCGQSHMSHLNEPRTDSFRLLVFSLVLDLPPTPRSNKISGLLYNTTGSVNAKTTKMREPYGGMYRSNEPLNPLVTMGLEPTVRFARDKDSTVAMDIVSIGPRECHHHVLQVLTQESPSNYILKILS
ncbi:hypothetical protein BS47DRAFT_1365972 [Hydnum rufescens UP504]|uniref:Uncharacterized protein n=1 Tax=Hydnum rufescens UP504 TaxID=1448309 RepID=A0A9P6AMI4_9AGAM|nr:hypothetical protein BS47DRAFT_1365972 [Hydnum rufescens UP504]